MKKILTALLTGAMILSMTACGGVSSSSQAQESTTSAANSDLEDFDIVLDWYPNAVHSFIYVAMEKGYYAEEGLNVHVQFPSSSSDPMTMTAAGKADAGLYYQSNIVISAANQDVPLQVLGTVVQHPLNILMFMKDSGITSISDLKGKTVGYSGIEADEFFMKAMLESVGLSFDDITMVDVGFDLNAALITGNVDALIGGYINHEYPTLISEGYDVSYLNLTTAGIPDYEELVLVTGQDQVKNESDKLARFIRASQKGFEDVKNDPEAALQILLDNQDEANYPLDADIEKMSMDILLPMMYSDDQGFLELNEDSWNEMITWLSGQGMINTKIPANDLLADLNK